MLAVQPLTPAPLMFSEVTSLISPFKYSASPRKSCLTAIACFLGAIDKMGINHDAEGTSDDGSGKIGNGILIHFSIQKVCNVSSKLTCICWKYA